jgi:hypothetical protein
MAQEKIVISSPWGELTAELVDNAATKALLEMLPVTLEMSDHLRQEKTGNLPASLPRAERQLDFSNGTLGLWASTDFVIYYRDGSVPRPGIVILGRVDGDASLFDRPGPVTVQIHRAR